MEVSVFTKKDNEHISHNVGMFPHGYNFCMDIKSELKLILRVKNSLWVLLLLCQVTQHFFDTVSTQLERWYERKLVEVKQQMELKAQQDRKELLQRISLLEEELERLKINESAESYVP